MNNGSFTGRLRSVDFPVKGFQRRASSCVPGIRGTSCSLSKDEAVPVDEDTQGELTEGSCVPTQEDAEVYGRSPSVTSCSVRGDSVGSTLSDLSDCVSPTFHYKKYRYEETETVEKRPRHDRPRPPVKKEDTSHAADGRSEHISVIQSWDLLPVHTRFLREKADNIGPTGMCTKNRLPRDIEQVGEVLRRAYDADAKDIAWSLNTVSIMPDGVPSDKPDTRTRASCPKTLWLRGGRVYDYFGDLGTIAEFISESTPWQTLRSRRRDLGLQPFPFLPQPLGEKNEDGAILKYQEELKRWTQKRIGCC